MKTVSKRELNQQTDRIERIRSEGRIIPAKKSAAPWPERDHSTRTPADVDALLAEMREVR